MARASRGRGQTMVEMALVAPLFFMVLIGIIGLGIGVFYQQQLTNAAREAARFASTNSATAQCPTVSRLDPIETMLPPSGSYDRCDRPEEGWPRMTAAGRGAIFGLNPSAVIIAACWSGYRINDGTVPPQGAYDAPPPGTYDDIGTIDSGWAACTIGGADPRQNAGSIGCDGSTVASTVDQASAISESPANKVANQVTAYACAVWRPPLAGFLLIPSEVTLRAVITEPIQRQQ
jgi:TadE-like protein